MQGGGLVLGDLYGRMYGRMYEHTSVTCYGEGGKLRGGLGFDDFKNHSPIRVRKRISLICGRTDLRIGTSKAKFDARLDFEVHLAVAAQRPLKTAEKLIFRIRTNPFLCFFVFFCVGK